MHVKTWVMVVLVPMLVSFFSLHEVQRIKRSLETRLLISLAGQTIPTKIVWIARLAINREWSLGTRLLMGGWSLGTRLLKGSGARGWVMV